MESRPRLIPQIYGYAVCLVTVVTILIASSRLVDGIFDAVTPEMSRDVDMALGGSFEIYKEQRRPTRAPGRAPSAEDATQEVTPDSVLRRMYEDERGYRIAAARYRGIRQIIGAIVMLVVAGGLFGAHWRWLRRMGQASPA